MPGNGSSYRNGRSARNREMEASAANQRMADAWTRIKNVFTNEQARGYQEAYQQGYQQATEKMRDEVLGRVPEIRQEWTQELRANPGKSFEVDQRQADRIRDLDKSLEPLRQMNPGIQAHVDPEQVRQVAHESAEVLRQRSSEPGSQRQVLGRENQEDPDRDRKRGYEETRANLESQLGKSLAGITVRNWGEPSIILQEHRTAVHDIALQARQELDADWGDRGRRPGTIESSDYYAGARQSIMDWSHQSDHALEIQEREQQLILSSQEQRGPSRENLPAQYVEWINPEVIGASQHSIPSRAVSNLDVAVETPSVERDLGVSV